MQRKVRRALARRRSEFGELAAATRLLAAARVVGVASAPDDPAAARTTESPPAKDMQWKVSASLGTCWR